MTTRDDPSKEKLYLDAPFPDKDQAKALGAQTRFKPAVGAVAGRAEFACVVGATPYALRRGFISLRLRTEDPQIVASECGTSLKMLSDHYSFPIEELRHHAPRPADVEWGRTHRFERAACAGTRTTPRALRPVLDATRAQERRA
jgi:hypothetical protein